MIKLYLNAFNASSYYWWYLQTVYINFTDDLYLLIVHIGCTHCLYLRTKYYLYSQKSIFGLYLLTVIGNCWLHLLYEPSYWLYFLTILTTYQFYSLIVIAECKNCLLWWLNMLWLYLFTDYNYFLRYKNYAYYSSFVQTNHQTYIVTDIDALTAKRCWFNC